MVDAGLFRTDHPEGAAFFLRPIQQAFGIPRIDGLPVDQVSGGVVGILPVVGQIVVKLQAVEQMLTCDLEF